jgi:2-succinyl-5-enolpyruvyl-6-hydroxy-3-cyclohexene-1-carboxylate synthase
MKYSTIPLAHTLVYLCRSFGIRQVVISPGSRNAPLILGFSADPFFECFSIVDERSAGFFALGLSQQSGEPTALVCTSGSALLNYYPAVAEAYYSRIPLVVISADRPPYKVDIGDGQTIRQAGVFEKHIGFQADLLQDVSHAVTAYRWREGERPDGAEAFRALQAERQAQNERSISRGLQVARRDRLPVHFNAPFEEPLYGTSESPVVTPLYFREEAQPEAEPEWEVLAQKWRANDRKMILIGALPPGSLTAETLALLGADPSVMVFTETTSNVHHPSFFPSIDAILAPLERTETPEAYFEALRPDLLLTLGGMVVSKKIKQFLRKYPPAEHWHADPHQAFDTFYVLRDHFRLEAARFLQGLLTRVQPGTFFYRKAWEAFREACRRQREAYLEQVPFSDMAAFRDILHRIPPGVQVQLANSSTVRYTQLFDMHPSNPVFCNRGTSGIEGSTSTAVGASVGSCTQVVLLTGDLSFLYDQNGLWNSYLRPDFRVVVINNQGGGIFRILPGKEESVAFETFFETVQEGALAPICETHGLEYRFADSREGLCEALEGFFAPSEKPRLLEVKTPRKVNDGVLLGYFDFLTSAIPVTL